MGYAQVKRFFHGLLFVLVAIASNGHAAEPCPAPPNEGDWSAQCFESAGTERRVKPRYLRNVRFGKNGVATIRIEQPMELVAVDRRGRVIFPGYLLLGRFRLPLLLKKGALVRPVFFLPRTVVLTELVPDRRHFPACTRRRA